MTVTVTGMTRNGRCGPGSDVTHCQARTARRRAGGPSHRCTARTVPVTRGPARQWHTDSEPHTVTVTGTRQRVT